MPKVLVVDDDFDFQEVHRLVLESKGFEVSSAYDAEEAIREITEDRPDIVILDVMLPDGYEGFEVARQVREDFGDRELPILMLTSIHTRKPVPYRFAPDDEYLPVDVFLDKPVEPEQLADKLTEMLGGGPASDEGKVEYL